MKAIEINIFNKEEYGLNEVFKLKKEKQLCGVTTKVFNINSKYGSGILISVFFNGLTVRYIDAQFIQDLTFKGEKQVDALIFSALLKGEKKVRLVNTNTEMIQENYEGYISYMNKINGSLTYSKNKVIKEVIIKMSLSFIKKHELDTLFPIFETYSVQKIKRNFINQLSNKTQDILTEIINDKRIGLLKRLFLESKVLELLALQIDLKDKKKTKSNAITKKIYLVENIIIKNIDTQISINNLSKKVFLNERILKKEFKRIFGTTIFEFALKTRMNKAKKLLSHTSKPIYEIAELVGYKNSTHFSAAFKKKEKTTPKEYRELRFNLRD